MAAEFTVGKGRSIAVVRDFLANLNLEREWGITIKRKTNKRSLNQNALYHKWVGIIANQTGYAHDEVTDWLKGQFLAPVFVEIDGRAIERRRSTTTMSVGEMAAYMDQIHAWATAEMGWRLPVPEEMHMENV